MKGFRDNSTESFQIYCMCKVSETIWSGIFSKIFQLKASRNSCNEMFQFFLKCKLSEIIQVTYFPKIFQLKAIRNISIWNISDNIFQSYFRIIAHEMWKVEIVLKAFWKLSETFCAVWAFTLTIKNVLDSLSKCYEVDKNLMSYFVSSFKVRG
jgi:hypothetical protein